MAEMFRHEPLQQARIAAQGCFLLDAFNPPHVSIDSPALDVMTDLARLPAATITSEATLDEANRSMIIRGVRLLLVTEQRRVVGLVTTNDILGEAPVLAAQRRQISARELRVGDVMVPLERIEALSIDDVRRSEVGHIVATLKADGRAHALVLGQDDQGHQVLVGIFSASQIARQLGVQIQTYEVARTFAEIEAALAPA